MNSDNGPVDGRRRRAWERAARRAGYRSIRDWATAWLERVEQGLPRYVRHDPGCHKTEPPGSGGQECTCGLDHAWSVRTGQGRGTSEGGGGG